MLYRSLEDNVGNSAEKGGLACEISEVRLKTQGHVLIVRLLWFWLFGAEESALINKIPELLKCTQAVDLQCQSIVQIAADGTAHDCHTHKPSSLHTTNGELVSDDRLMVPVVFRNKGIGFFQRNRN